MGALIQPIGCRVAGVLSASALRIACVVLGPRVSSRQRFGKKIAADDLVPRHFFHYWCFFSSVAGWPCPGKAITGIRLMGSRRRIALVLV